MELNQKLLQKLYDNEKETFNKYHREMEKEHKEKIEKLNKEIIPKINHIDNEIKKLKNDLNEYKRQIELIREKTN